MTIHVHDYGYASDNKTMCSRTASFQPARYAGLLQMLRRRHTVTERDDRTPSQKSSRVHKQGEHLSKKKIPSNLRPHSLDFSMGDALNSLPSTVSNCPSAETHEGRRRAVAPTTLMLELHRRSCIRRTLCYKTSSES